MKKKPGERCGAFGLGCLQTITEFLGLDIGGGSTECILASNERMPKVISLDLGVVRLLERAFHHDPPTTHDLHNAEICIDEALAKVKQVFGSVSNIPLVGTAGTITTLAAMNQGLEKYDRTRVHNYELTFSTVKNLEKKLINNPASERLKISGLEAGREFVIVAGAAILRRVMGDFRI